MATNLLIKEDATTNWIRPDHATAIGLTTGAGAWDLTGAKTEIVPANSITSNFKILTCQVRAVSEWADVQLDFYSGGVGAEVLIGTIRANRDLAGASLNPICLHIPTQPANTRISCRMSSDYAGALTATISLMGVLA